MERSELNMSIVDEIIEALKGKKTPQEKSQIIDQILREKQLYETLKSAGLTLTPTEATERARLKPEGIMSLVEKVNLIDLITKITEITTIKTLEKLNLIVEITRILEARLIQDKGAIDGTDIDAEGEAIVPSGVLTEILSLNIPVGNTLLIYDWSVAIETSSDSVYADIYNATTDVIYGYGGGFRGFQTPFSKPKKVVGASILKVRAIHNAEIAQTIHGHVGGIFY